MSNLLTYDVDSSHTNIKNHLIGLGYQDQISGRLATSPGVFNGAVSITDLPNTTLHHPSRTHLQGLADIRTTAALFSAVLEKAIAVDLASGNWTSI